LGNPIEQFILTEDENQSFFQSFLQRNYLVFKKIVKYIIKIYDYMFPSCSIDKECNSCRLRPFLVLFFSFALHFLYTDVIFYLIDSAGIFLFSGNIQESLNKIQKKTVDKGVEMLLITS
jgi:hypothetical protein